MMTDRQLPDASWSPIKVARRTRGLTQAQLASVCDLAQYQVSRIEVGRVRPNRRTRERLARVLAVAVDRLWVDHGGKV